MSSHGSVGSSTTVGARLRAAREKRGIPLRQIAERTRISVMILEALERDDIKRLPGGIFTRSFLRTYASEVGLDPDGTVDDFLAQFPPESVDAGTVGHETEDTQAIESDRRAAQTLVRLVVVSLPIVAVVVYVGLRQSGPSKPVAPARPVATSAAGAKSTTLTPSSGRPTVPTTDAKSAPTELKPSTPGVNSAELKPSPKDASVATDVKVPSPALKRTDSVNPQAVPDSLMMVIDQPSRCWVAVAVDGEAVSPERLVSGQRLELKATREIVVTVGEDTPCAYTLNGATGRPLGQQGAIVTRRISTDNYRTYLSQ